MITAVLPVRGADPHGSGEWGAGRGSRTHKGIDYACLPGSLLRSPVEGKVTKLGYPYRNDLSFRYVEVSGDSGKKHRFFYISPKVKVGDDVLIGDILGEVQDLERRYSGITCHVHYEIKRGSEYLNPSLESV